MADPVAPRPDRPGTAPPDSTAVLFERIHAGDDEAREELFRRFHPLLRRWAHGRLPVHARGLADTDDLVQVTLLRALNRLDAFEPRREGAFLAYLRHILLNTVREELRRSVRKPAGRETDPEQPADAPSPLEQAVGRDAVERYEAALAELPPDQREAVMLRIEFDYGYAEIAAALDRPSANAVRMTISRALVRIAERMGG